MAVQTVGSGGQVTTDAEQERLGGNRRDPFFDNAKFLAIALVVIGHAIGPILDVPVADATFMAIYSFHMPAFVLLAGYLSRSFTGRPRQARRVITTIVVPYLIFESAYELFLAGVKDRPVKLDVLDPSYAMWFLCALFIWRLSAPLWRALEPSAAIAIAVVISVLSGTMSLPEVLDLHRTLGFLPFFVVGLVLPLDRYLAFIRTNFARALAVPALLALFAFSSVLLRYYSNKWLYFAQEYGEFGVGDVMGVAARSVTLLAAFALVTAFFALVPQRRTWFTALGAGTLYVYLLHRFVVKGAAFAGVYDVPALHTPLGVAAVVVLALGLTVALSSQPVRTLLRPFIEPQLGWLFRAEPAKTAVG